MSSIIRTLQEAIKTRLAANTDFAAGVDPVTAAVPILTEQHGVIENEVARAVGKIGVSVVVLTPRLAPIANATNGASELTVVVAVTENVLVNRSGSGSKKPATDLAEAAWASLQGWTPAGGWSPMRIKGLSLVSNSPLVIYEMVAATTIILRPITA